MRPFWPNTGTTELPAMVDAEALRRAGEEGPELEKDCARGSTGPEHVSSGGDRSTCVGSDGEDAKALVWVIVADKPCPSVGGKPQKSCRRRGDGEEGGDADIPSTRRGESTPPKRHCSSGRVRLRASG